MIASRAVDVLVEDLRRVFSERLQSVVIYGAPAEHLEASDQITALAVVSSLGTADLEACAVSAARWAREGLATPLILPDVEFRRSLDAFSLECAEMQRTHRRVYGSDPFEGIVIQRDDLRRACERQIKSHLLHLREEFINAGMRPDEVAEIVYAAAPALAGLLRTLAHLHGVTLRERSALTMEGARLAGLDPHFVTALQGLDRKGGVTATDGARLFPAYLAAVEQVASYVDGGAW